MEDLSMKGFDLERLRQQYRYDLFEDFLPFMEKFVIDHELGGFMCNTDRDGSHINTNKNSWYNGRGLWVYSFLYNEVAQEEKYLEVARKAVEFILKDQPKGKNLWTAEYTREGEPIESKGIYTCGKYVPISKEIYGDLFIVEGLAEYGRATGDEQYRQMAKDILLKCVEIYDQADYSPGGVKVYIGPEASELPGARVLGAWMLMLRIGMQMLEHKADEQIEAVVERCIDAIFNYHYNSEYDLINEVLNHDMSRGDNEYRDVVYPGHGMETLWMVMDEARRRSDKELFEKAGRLFQRHMEVAWDDVYGGFFRGLLNVDENKWVLDKTLWVQEEVLIGNLMVIEHTNAEWAKKWFCKTFRYVHDKLSLKKHGLSLFDFWPDRKATFVEHYPRIENYHHPRHLMLNLLGIERMIKRGGKTSGVFD